MYSLQENVDKPQKQSSFPFLDIKVGGALFIVPEEGENMDKLATKVRNATNNFKKGHEAYNLSVHVYKEKGQIMVYRDEVTSGE